jgi:hypothetical protein
VGACIAQSRRLTTSTVFTLDSGFRWQMRVNYVSVRQATVNARAPLQNHLSSHRLRSTIARGRLSARQWQKTLLV